MSRPRRRRSGRGRVRQGERRDRQTRRSQIVLVRRVELLPDRRTQTISRNLGQPSDSRVPRHADANVLITSVAS